MSGKVPLSRRARINQAATLYEDFTGHDADEAETRDKPEFPDVLVVIGEVEGIIYNTVRDGVSERYIHRFKSRSRPTFCVTPDGKQLVLLDGDYDFTERGIVDS